MRVVETQIHMCVPGDEIDVVQSAVVCGNLTQLLDGIMHIPVSIDGYLIVNHAGITECINAFRSKQRSVRSDGRRESLSVFIRIITGK